MKTIVRLWTVETIDVFFYNEARAIIRLCEKHPIVMCNYKLLTRCLRVQKMEDFQKGNRYREGMRSPDGLCWIWVLKVCVALL